MSEPTLHVYERFEQKKAALFQFDPEAIVGDNAYFQAMRVRRWAAKGILVLSPAAAWKTGSMRRLVTAS
jgi:hypothetical protein